MKQQAQPRVFSCRSHCPHHSSAALLNECHDIAKQLPKVLGTPINAVQPFCPAICLFSQSLHNNCAVQRMIKIGIP